MQDWQLGWSLLATFLFVIAFRGGIDVLAHKLIPRASLFGAGRELLAEDVVARRRVGTGVTSTAWRSSWCCWSTFVLTAMSLTGVTASRDRRLGRQRRCR